MTATRWCLLVTVVLSTQVGAAPKKATANKPPPAAPAPAEPKSAEASPAAEPTPARESTPAPVEPAASTAAAPSAINTSARPRLVVMGLTPAGGVEPAVAESLTEAVAAEASRVKLFEVTSQKDFTTLLGLERQKQLVGCSEGNSCMAELADALGARFVLSGSVARLGEAFQLNLQTIDTTRTQTVGRATRIANDLGQLRDQIPYAFAEASATPPPEPPSNALPITLMSLGAGCALASGFTFFQSYSREQAALAELELSKTQPQLQLKTAAYYQDEAKAVVQQRIVAAVLLGVGVGVAVTGIVIYRARHKVSSGTQVALMPSGAGASLVGVFP